MLLKSIVLLIPVLIFFAPPGFAQNNSGETFAIVVGISKYRYIKPLSYADSDAELFTERSEPRRDYDSAPLLPFGESKLQ